MRQNVEEMMERMLWSDGDFSVMFFPPRRGSGRGAGRNASSF